MPRFAVLLVALLCVAVFALSVPPAVFAKKPVKPPPVPDPEPDPDPAIVYRLLDDGVRKLMVMNADGSNQTMVLNLTGNVLTRPDWSPDGKKIVFGSDLNDEMGVYVVNVDGTGLRKVVSTVNRPEPVWSPGEVPGVGDDSERIAYLDKASPNATWEVGLFLVKPDGTDRVQVDDYPEDGWYPTWSPDATRLAFSEMNSDGRYCVLDLADESYTSYQFTGAMAEETPFCLSWAKTQDDKIAFTVIAGSNEWDLYILDLDTPTTATRLTSARGIESVPSWSPDDSEIVFQARPRKNGDYSITVTISSDGTSFTKLQSGGMLPTWRR